MVTTLTKSRKKKEKKKDQDVELARANPCAISIDGAIDLVHKFIQGLNTRTRRLRMELCGRSSREMRMKEASVVELGTGSHRGPPYNKSP